MHQSSTFALLLFTLSSIKGSFPHLTLQTCNDTFGIPPPYIPLECLSFSCLGLIVSPMFAMLGFLYIFISFFHLIVDQHIGSLCLLLLMLLSKLMNHCSVFFLPIAAFCDVTPIDPICLNPLVCPCSTCVIHY